VNELALFAGAGGGILAGHLLGWRTVCAVEIEDYPRRVLLQRQADGLLPRFPIWDDICTFDGKPWAGKVDVVTGGFPCQDISAAGKGKGLDGERSGLWGEMARVICEVRPRYAFIENSQCSRFEDSTEFCATLPKWGLMLKGECWEQQTLEHSIKGTGFGLSLNYPPPPPPSKWPTPTTPSGGGNVGGSGAYKNAIKNGTHIPHSINPSLYEWLMGWPIGWTDLSARVTAKWPFAQQQHGNYSVKESND